MGKSDIDPGSSTIEHFFWWINERTRMWNKRFVQKLSKPWTDDKIMQEYKFTNAYRQLDRGTIALEKMIKPYCDELRARYTADVPATGHSRMFMDREAELEKLIAFNIHWYRLFNLDTHAYDCGWCDNFEKLEAYIRTLAADRKQIFTSAHMTTGREGEEKFESYLEAAKEAWKEADVVVTSCLTVGTLYSAFETLKQFYMVGPFVGYEMVCDLRFTPLLENAPDKLTWANVGPGAKRGMIRLGFAPTIESMTMLYDIGIHGEVQGPVLDYAGSGEPLKDGVRPVMQFDNPLLDRSFGVKWPFELREIEHSLCEFDKYERVRTGVGRPRSRFNGKADPPDLLE